MSKYLQKLVSLNPDKFEYIPMEEAIDKYSTYIKHCLESDFNIYTIKSLAQWLTTEI